jgi:uncharacterized repeat protein (TIGR04138 family)
MRRREFFMNLNFDQIVSQIVATNPKYEVGAYRFVREGLDYTLKSLKRTRGRNTQRHVTGAELLDGLRQYTLKEFGPMGKVVLNEWGLTTCEDFGHIVFVLVEHGVLGKSENDSLDDFRPIYTFEEAFEKPFAPAPKQKAKRKREPKAASKKGRLNSQSKRSLPSAPNAE